MNSILANNSEHYIESKSLKIQCMTSNISTALLGWVDNLYYLRMVGSYSHHLMLILFKELFF